MTILSEGAPRGGADERSPDEAATPLGPGGLFADIEAILGRQLREVQQGNVDAAQTLGLQVDALLRRAREAQTVPDPAYLARVDGLYNAIALALAQQAHEVAEKRSRLRQGRPSISAYRRAAGR